MLNFEATNGNENFRISLQFSKLEANLTGNLDELRQFFG